MIYSLRSATESDREFLWRLLVASMRPAVEQTWGWDDAEQRRFFDESFDADRAQIIVVDGEDAGLLIVEQHGEELDVHEIQLMPQHQKRGIGTAVLRDVFRRADAHRLPVVLRVLKVNDAARRLYERLGFRVTGEVPTHHLMRRDVPNARPDSTPS